MMQLLIFHVHAHKFTLQSFNMDTLLWKVGHKCIMIQFSKLCSSSSDSGWNRKNITQHLQNKYKSKSNAQKICTWPTSVEQTTHHHLQCVHICRWWTLDIWPIGVCVITKPWSLNRMKITVNHVHTILSIQIEVLPFMTEEEVNYGTFPSFS